MDIGQVRAIERQYLAIEARLAAIEDALQAILAIHSELRARADALIEAEESSASI